MTVKRTHQLLFAAVAVVLSVAAFSLVGRPGTPSSPDNVMSLKAPSFVGVARADTGAISSFPEEEAGIAAYTKVAGPIDLSTVRSEFRTIERETSEYIIGSVGVPDYSEDHDPHVYVHVDGWVLAYYLNTEPASYMIDLRHYDGIEIDSSKLEDAIYEILISIGVVSFDTTYYDFRYPNATHIMLIAEAIYEAGDESFSVYLPGDFSYYDRSWSHAYDVYGYADSDLYLDGGHISHLAVGDWLFASGSFTAAEFPRGTSHTIRIELQNSNGDAFCAIALVYQEVP